jgi:TonB family protein
MKKIFPFLLWLTLFATALPSFAQEQDTTYHNQLELTCDADTAYFYRISKKLSSLLHVREFYSETDQLKAEYAKIYDRYYYVYHGEYKSYHENGQLAKEANYEQGKAVGTITEWYENAQKFAIWNHDEKGRKGLQQSWYKAGKEMVQEGKGQYEEFYDNGKIKVRGEVNEASQTGTWQSFHENGKLLHQFTVVDGMFSGKEEIWDPNGKPSYQYNHAPKGETESFNYWDAEGNVVYESGDFLNEDGLLASWQDQWGNIEPQPMNMNDVRRAIGYPEIARDAGIQGQIIVMAKVNKWGAVDSVRLERGVHPILDEPVAKNSWDIKFTPTIIDGELAPFWVHIPFRFKLIDGGPLFQKKKKKRRRRG